jgi:hypothetical protein
MKVRIAFVTKPGTEEIDTDRIGTIEDHPVEDAKRMIRDGIAAEATADELADWDTEVERRLAAEGGDLSSKTVKQLREEYPDAVAGLPGNARKDDVIAAIEEARRAQITGAGDTTSEQGAVDGDSGAETAITTVAPGVGEGPGGSDEAENAADAADAAAKAAAEDVQ